MPTTGRWENNRLRFLVEAAGRYVSHLPAVLRTRFRRPSDHTGRTIPSDLPLRRAEDLRALIPDRPPRFQAGQRPLPGVDLELVELLGVGGFGEVWKARNPHLDGLPPVALKFCLEAGVDQGFLRHEAAVLNQVIRQGRHDGIVQLRQTYLSADPPCLEYEFVEGGDLSGLIREWHRSNGASSALRATEVLVRLAEIVGFAHRLTPPIVHRDLKPANILVRSKAEGGYSFHITDFGIGGIAVRQAIE